MVSGSESLAAESVVLAKEAERVGADLQMLLQVLGKIKTSKDKLDQLLRDPNFTAELSQALEVEMMDLESLSTILHGMMSRLAEALFVCVGVTSTCCVVLPMHCRITFLRCDGMCSAV